MSNKQTHSSSSSVPAYLIAQSACDNQDDQHEQISFSTEDLRTALTVRPNMGEGRLVASWTWRRVRWGSRGAERRPRSDVVLLRKMGQDILDVGQT